MRPFVLAPRATVLGDVIALVVKLGLAGTRVDVAVGVAVFVEVLVEVDVLVLVAVRVGVRVKVGVLVTVGVLVRVGVAVDAENLMFWWFMIEKLYGYTVRASSSYT